MDLRDETGNTALHVACRRGQKRAMKALLRAGANVLACNEDGLTPLHFTEASRTPSPPPLLALQPHRATVNPKPYTLNTSLGSSTDV